MNLPKIDLSEAVAALLARGEPLTAARLAAATQKSTSSISLAVQKLGERVHRIGAARSTRYALKKDISGLAAQQALLWNGLDIEGNMPQPWGELTYLYGDWLHVKSENHSWLTQGKLPWFLTPLRPLGFLGRELARSRQDFPPDPDRWSLEQILYVAIDKVDDVSGAFFFNSIEATSWSAPETANGLAQHYDQLAQQVGASLPAGSSAAGEQPKFLVNRRSTGWFLIKFSPPRDTPFGERWNAMLLLEKLALNILQVHGIPSANTQIIQSTKRTYLQSQRFDRNVDHQMRHVVPIAALHDEFVDGSWANWVKTSEALAKKGLITTGELSQVASIFAFGHYIGNTDMHSGNLSFYVDDVITPKIRLAPVYDMLPMMWRPDIHQGALSDSPVRPQLMPTGFIAEQAQAREWAIEFWERAAQLDIGADLQSASLESARRLKTNFADI
jgi:HipA-like C-terminal domain